METMWFYTQGASDRQGPVPESDIRKMVAAGTLKGRDLVWKDGMTDWVEVRQVEELRPAKAAHPVLVPQAAGLPPRLTGWMGFVGVMTIISGVLLCITCLGIILGIFMIVGGSALMSARSRITSMGEIDDRLLPFFRDLNRYVVMMAAAYIGTVVVWLIIFLVNMGGVLMF